jgi:hypothetical protein
MFTKAIENTSPKRQRVNESLRHSPEMSAGFVVEPQAEGVRDFSCGVRLRLTVKLMMDKEHISGLVVRNGPETSSCGSRTRESSD